MNRNWIAITNVENIPPHEGRPVQVGDLHLALFNLGDRFAAIENECPHKGGPLCDGIVSGSVVVCPLHGWRFDLSSGMAVRAPEPACVATFPARVLDGIVHVDLGGAGFSLQRGLESPPARTEAEASVAG